MSDCLKINMCQSLSSMTIIELCELDMKCNVNLHFEHFLLLVVTMAAIPDISTRVLQCSVIWWLWRTEDKSACVIQRELAVVFGADTYSVQTVRAWLHEFRGGRDQVHDKARSG